MPALAVRLPHIADCGLMLLYRGHKPKSPMGLGNCTRRSPQATSPCTGHRESQEIRIFLAPMDFMVSIRGTIALAHG
ncbi:hypothetical protein JG687_00017419 [Phytophthora cactorum]|uniref:Uncharacterized protein n=1 Tax=Phytophthora cactorum TaxID=29920 RepID=A0A8T1TS46_9STRA|nr:hypothetical protein JG687_00017419 [Phytophthora cactorum]